MHLQSATLPNQMLFENEIALVLLSPLQLDYYGQFTGGGLPAES